MRRRKTRRRRDSLFRFVALIRLVSLAKKGVFRKLGWAMFLLIIHILHFLSLFRIRPLSLFISLLRDEDFSVLAVNLAWLIIAWQLPYSCRIHSKTFHPLFHQMLSNFTVIGRLGWKTSICFILAVHKTCSMNDSWSSINVMKSEGDKTSFGWDPYIWIVSVSRQKRPSYW